ncbi:MAG: DUF3325 domain-containing protein [Pseudomonadota bacterium]
MSLVVSLSLLAFASILCLMGMVGLALSQDRNWRSVGAGGAPAIWLRPTGWALIVASLVPSIFRDGPSFTGLIGPMLIAGAAFTVGMLLAYRPKWLLPLAKTFLRAPLPASKDT